MALKKASHWTELYYRVVEHYFWRPQAIGRKADPNKKSRSWDYWRNKLENQETPLNHMLDFLFYIAPEELLDLIVSSFLGRKIKNLEIVMPEYGIIDYNIVQPDIIIANGPEVVFVEMKVDSKSSVDQFAKYAIAAHYLMSADSTITSVDLVILSRHMEHKRLWKNSKKLGLTSEKTLREIAIKGIREDPSIWTEAGVKRFISKNPESLIKLIDRLKTMGLYLANYTLLEHILREFATRETGVRRLIEGVRAEFLRRNLI